MPDRRAFLAGTPALAAGVFVSAAAAADKDAGPAQFTGRVVPLKDLLAKAGVPLDRDAEPFWLALVTAEGKVHPIVKDAGGRRYFKDERLRNRDVRITGKLVAETGLLQVLAAVGMKDGKPVELFYWCDICAIKRHELMICECCGGPMELREEALGK